MILSLGPFTGLDVRRQAGAADPYSLRVANEIELTTDGSITSRSPWREVVTLPTNTIGLYTLGGQLRTIGWDNGTAPPVAISSEISIIVDAVTGTGFTDLTAALPYSGDQAIGVYPYVVLSKSGVYEHHWVRPNVTTTKITLPFTPGPAAIKMASKIFAPDVSGTDVRFSSTLNGPSDWTEESDAGFLPVSTHATGDRTVNGLGFYDNALAVIFNDSVQLWSVSPDPALHALSQIIDGVGTPFSRTASNVRGDLFYLARSGFENLRTVNNTGRIEPDAQLGSPIKPLTDVIDVSAITPIAMWFGHKAQYLCAIGSTVYVYTMFAGEINKRKGGWSIWTAPATITAMVELDDKLYIRCGNVIYTHDDAATEATSFDCQTQFQDAKKPGSLKQWQTIDVSQAGNAYTKLYPLSKYPTTYETGPDIIGSTDTIGDIPIMISSEILSIGMHGTVGGGADRWRLDRLTLRYIPLRG
jgi:hypothetical protein